MMKRRIKTLATQSDSLATEVTPASRLRREADKESSQAFFQVPTDGDPYRIMAALSLKVLLSVVRGGSFIVPALSEIFRRRPHAGERSPDHIDQCLV
jgi:hypothetical protein